MNRGWIRLYRKISDNKLWTSEPFTRGQAWVDMLLLANHKDGIIYVRGNRVDILRGQVGWSIIKLSKRWRWSRGKVIRFLNELEIEQQIVQQKNRLSSLFTIINYNEYQSDGTQIEQQTCYRRATDVLQTDTNKNDKKEKNVKKKHKYGEYKHVLLSDEEYEKLQKQFPSDCRERIIRLDEYIQQVGKKYKDHYLTILQWARKDKAQSPSTGSPGERSYIFDEMDKDAERKAKEDG